MLKNKYKQPWLEISIYGTEVGLFVVDPNREVKHNNVKPSRFGINKEFFSILYFLGLEVKSFYSDSVERFLTYDISKLLKTVKAFSDDRSLGMISFRCGFQNDFVVYLYVDYQFYSLLNDETFGDNITKIIMHRTGMSKEDIAMKILET